MSNRFHVSRVSPNFGAIGGWHTAQKAKTGVLVALAGATLTGGALAWANWLLDLGAHL